MRDLPGGPVDGLPLRVFLAHHGAGGACAAALLDPITSRVKALFPKSHIIPLPFTGPAHRGAAKSKADGHCASLHEALASSGGSSPGLTAVLPLYVVAGEEFQALAACVQGFDAGSGPRVVLAKPLLAGREDIPALVLALLESLPPERLPGEAVVLMGHGARGPAQELYAGLARALRLADPLVRLATLRQSGGEDLGFAAVARDLAGLGVARAHLIPLLGQAGGHARKDMASLAPGSLASVLKNAGFDCRIWMEGLFLKPACLDLWALGLKGAMNIPFGRP